MTANGQPSADVVIVGGGPVGLMLAAELRLGGVDPVVLERLPAISEIPKGNGLFGQIVPMLDYRGLTDRFRAEATYAGPVPQFQFGPLQLDFTRLDNSPLHVLAMPQRRLERLLGDRLRELGGSVRRGHEVLGMSVAGDGLSVMLDAHGPDGDYRLRTRYLAGCDGAHSLVRKQAGIGFPGLTSSEISRIGRVVLPTVTIAPGGGQAEVPGLGQVRLMGPTQTARGVFTLAPLASLDKNAAPGVFIVHTREGENGPAVPSDERAADPGAGRAGSEAGTADPDAPMTLDELRASVRRVLGIDLPMTDPQWLTRTLGNSRTAERFRSGPVLLAGDAAHIFGAGGSLNAGLLDALNLGWKLAAQVRGWAPDGLLDSYHAERYAASRRTILQTRAQKALSAGGEYAQALRDLFAELLTYPEPARHVGAMIEGSDIRYQMRSPGQPPPATPLTPQPATHPLTGLLAPDLRLETSQGRTRVAELVRPARGVLLDLTADAGLAGAASGWADRLSVVCARSTAVPAPASAMLIRPDGYVAWAASADARDPALGLDQALRAWFGQPRAGTDTPVAGPQR
jgi:2-polyprenyl-6-methoxyphenol hydroxylase-like FAD-dependent oxidoreductase